MDVILRDIMVFLQSGNIWRHVLDLIDIGLVAFFLYRLFLLVRGTQAVQLMFGVLLLALIGLLANLLDLRLLSWIFRNAAPAILVGIIVLFQPEIRRALDQFGRIGFIGRPLAHYNLQIFNRMIDEVIRATTKLTQRFTGALIVFEKETGLENYANSGIRINGELTAEFLEAIFFPNSPLHDGAVIVRGNQILAAGCVLPLAEELGLGVLTHSPLRFGVLDRPPTPDAIKAFGVQTWAQAVLKWIASDPRVSAVLTATKTPGRPTENAQAGDPPWFDRDQRDRLAALLG